MTRRSPTTNRFAVAHVDGKLLARASGTRDNIQFTCDDMSIVVTQKRNRAGGTPTVAVSALLGLEAEEIGGPSNKTWAVLAHLKDAPRVLLVHSITQTEAEWLSDLLAQRYPQATYRRGFIQDRLAVLPPPPPSPTDPWSVDEWRNRPPIG